MNKINIFAVMSFGLFFNTPMYAAPQDPLLSAQKEDISTQSGDRPVPSEPIAIKTLEELKIAIQKEQERKAVLEKETSGILGSYKNKLDQTIKSVAKKQIRLLKQLIQQETSKAIDRTAKELSKNPMFRNNLENLPEKTLEENPLALKIAKKAAAEVEEYNAQLSDRLQKLKF